MFKISEQIKYKDKELYKKLKEMSKSKKEIKLGDRAENLMRHDSYKRVGRRVKQVGWGR